MQGKAQSARDAGTAERLERRVERDLAALGKADDADAIAIDAGLVREPVERAEGVTLAGSDRRDWSSAVMAMPRSVKLSTTNVATPSSFSRAAQACSRPSMMPPLPCMMIIAGWGADPPAGRDSQPNSGCGRPPPASISLGPDGLRDMK